jgi:peptide/nickel transport system permease protein
VTTVDAIPLGPGPLGDPVGDDRSGLRMGRRDRAAVRPAWRNPLALVGFGIILAWIVIAVFASVLAPYGPNDQLAPQLLSPSAHYVFGTDEVGRDVLSRVIYGARLSLPLAALLVVASMLIGTLAGTVAGFFGGVVDAVIMRVADLVFAFPGIILALAVAAALGPQLHNAVLAVIVVSWPSYARVARGLVLGARGADYVIAARLLGASGWRTMFVELRPNIAGPILVLGSLDVGNAVLLLSGLSFLGLGAQPPVAEWGAMVASGAQNFSDWWLGLFPGLAILTVVMAFNFVGDALRDLLDPRTARLMGK